MTAPTLRTESPMSGLAKGRLNPAQVVAQSVAAVAPSAVMVTLPAIVFPVAGKGTPLVFAGIAALMVCVAFCVNQFARRMVAVSGLYSYAVKGLGPVPGFAAGLSVAVGYAAAAMASVLGAASYGAALLDSAGLPTSRFTIAVGCLVVGAVAATLMVRGISLSARAALIVEVVAIILASAVLVVLATSDVAATPFQVGSTDTPQWGLALLLTIISYVGFESASTLAREARNPLTAIPRAILWTPVMTGILYVAASLLITHQSVVVSPSSGRVALSLSASGPLSTVLDNAMHLGILASWLACVIGSTTALSRTVFTMAREGVLPARLGRTHSRHRTPHVALWVLTPIVAGVPALAAVLGRDGRDLLVDLLTLSAHGYVTAYILVVVAAPLFLRRIGELTRPTMAISILTATTLTTIVVWGSVANVERFAWTVATYAALMVAGFAVLAFRVRRRPGVLSQLGMYDETTAADVLTPRAGWLMRP